MNEVTFWTRVEKTAGCWVWQGALTKDGYGNLRWAGGHDYAHRVAYTLLVGPIPAGMLMDHLCRNRACCRPEHLEPVTQAENNRRGLVSYDLRRTCKHGHNITDPANVYVEPSGHRRCRTCATRDQVARADRKVAAQ